MGFWNWLKSFFGGESAPKNPVEALDQVNDVLGKAAEAAGKVAETKANAEKVGSVWSDIFKK